MSDERVDRHAFWEWAYSDFLSNTLRGVLAEYLVARALGCTARPRREWDACDLRTKDGLNVEVKSASRFQSWPQAKPSVLGFDVARRQGWDAETNTSASESGRSAHVYVFCVFEPGDGNPKDPLDPQQWFFLVCSTSRLESLLGAQKSVRLARLEALGLVRLTYGELAAAVREASRHTPWRTPATGAGEGSARVG